MEREPHEGRVGHDHHDLLADGDDRPLVSRHRDWALGAESNPYAWEARDDIPGGVASKPLGPDERITVPAAVALFPADPPAAMPREWAGRGYVDLRRFTRMSRGGHFPTLEAPELLAEDFGRSFVRFAAVDDRRERARRAGGRMTNRPTLRLDHCVVTVSDWERSNDFYRDVLNAEVARGGQG